MSCPGLAARPEPRMCPKPRDLGGAVACPWQAPLPGSTRHRAHEDRARARENRVETGRQWYGRCLLPERAAARQQC